MQKILITYGTRPLAQRVANMIKEKYEVQFATSESIPSVLQKQYIPIPTGVNPTFAHELLKLCLDNQISYLLALGFKELETLSEAKLLFEEYDIHLLGPDLEELKELFVLQNPNKGLELQLVHHGVNVLDGLPVAYIGSGLMVLSDEGEEFALCTI